jgi:c-di-GMP-binding flagellar brake protein YcgR
VTERRRFARVALGEPVEFSKDDQDRQDLPFEGTAGDLSVGGMCIETARPARAGQGVIIFVILPGERRELRLRAVVRWRHEDYMGVEFGLLRSRDAREVAEYVKARGQARPDSH